VAAKEAFFAALAATPVKATVPGPEAADPCADPRQGLLTDTGPAALATEAGGAASGPGVEASGAGPGGAPCGAALGPSSGMGPGQADRAGGAVAAWEAPLAALAQLLGRLPQHCINERAYIEVRLHLGWEVFWRGMGTDRSEVWVWVSHGYGMGTERGVWVSWLDAPRGLASEAS
jgi:hypothetical protein